MVTPVSDPLSNRNDQKVTIADRLARSERLTKVFRAIYSGKQQAKTVGMLVTATKLNNVGVLQQGAKLADLHAVEPIKIKGQTAYRKIRSIAGMRDEILRLARNPKRRKSLPTKINPGGGTRVVRIVVPAGRNPLVKMVTIDDFDQFERVRKIVSAPKRKISERRFKDGIRKIIGESGYFQDWGGEPNDLYTSKLRYKGTRKALAFAFKGPGTTGRLVPKKLGKNGDQIGRLFLAPAEIFVVQYHAEIDESVVRDMTAYATARSAMEGKAIFIGVIDGDDTNRLVAAYSRAFGLK